MKWKIIHSCSKPPTRWDFVMGIKSATYDEEKSKVLVRPDQKSCADVCLIFRYWGSKPLPGQEKNHGIFFFEFVKNQQKKSIPSILQLLHVISGPPWHRRPREPRCWVQTEIRPVAVVGAVVGPKWEHHSPS